MANAKLTPPSTLSDATFAVESDDEYLKLSLLAERLAEAVAAGFGDFNVVSAESEYGAVRLGVERDSD